jgi:hypothetical protein
VENNNNNPLREEWDFAVHASVYGKVQASPDVTSNDEKRRKGRRRGFLLARRGLPSYLCRLCTLRVHLSVLGEVSTPPQYHRNLDASQPSGSR